MSRSEWQTSITERDRGNVNTISERERRNVFLILGKKLNMKLISFNYFKGKGTEKRQKWGHPLTSACDCSWYRQSPLASTIRFRSYEWKTSSSSCDWGRRGKSLYFQVLGTFVAPFFFRIWKTRRIVNWQCKYYMFWFGFLIADY